MAGQVMLILVLVVIGTTTRAVLHPVRPFLFERRVGLGPIVVRDGMSIDVAAAPRRAAVEADPVLSRGAAAGPIVGRHGLESAGGALLLVSVHGGVVTAGLVNAEGGRGDEHMAGYVRTVLDGRYRPPMVLATVIQNVIVTGLNVGAASRDCVVCHIVGKTKDVY